MEEIKSFSEWSSTMDGTAHAPMHYRIKGDMASKYTALDPLFYVHHAFIDKLWVNFLFLYFVLFFALGYVFRYAS